MRKIFILIFSIAFTSLNAQQSQVFINKGVIEFEKQLNLHKEIDDSWDNGEDNIWKQNMKKNLPKVQTTYFNLYFKDNKTVYKQGKEAPQGLQKIPDWMADRTLENVVYNDLDKQETIAQKSVFEQTFLVQDSITKINWRITNDTRTIAGIECRKAIGKVMDSVYVIAFYTDLIECSGGPMGITGLPGMILGVAIPRMNTTWFATKVQMIEVKETDMAIPKKGKKSTTKEILQTLQKSTKDWGKEGQRNIWRLLL